MNRTGTLLIAAADVRFKQLITTALREDAHTLVEADDGRQVLTQYGQLRPDLVLLEVDLSGGEDLDVCRRLVAEYGDECAPLLFFASAATPEQIAEGFAAGASDFISKEATAEEIQARARSHLQTFLLLKEQKAMAEQLGRANAAKNRFIGMAAHDMRNPLVSIRGFSEFLMEGTVGPMPASQLALVTIIHGTSNAMIKTLNELLDVATIDAGQLKLQVSTHSLVDLVTKAIGQARIEARKKRSRIELLTPASQPVLAFDGDKIKQVIDALLSNAIKFSPPASVLTVAIEVTADGKSCGFLIRDQGPGMPPDALARLTTGRTVVAEETTTGEKTAGLGLIISRNIVAAHDGSIEATNREKGCEVRVRLPRVD